MGMGDRLASGWLLIGTAIFSWEPAAMTAPSLGMFGGRFVQAWARASCPLHVDHAALPGGGAPRWAHEPVSWRADAPYFAGLLVDALSWRAIFPAIALTAVIGFTIRHNIRLLTTPSTSVSAHVRLAWRHFAEQRWLPCSSTRRAAR